MAINQLTRPHQQPKNSAENVFLKPEQNEQSE